MIWLPENRPPRQDCSLTQFPAPNHEGGVGETTTLHAQNADNADQVMGVSFARKYIDKFKVELLAKALNESCFQGE